MTKHDERHYAADPELVERYVLGRLDRELLERFDAHLRDCPDCRKAVDLERGIAAGIRTFARDDMKRRLAQRVAAAPPAVTVPWPRIAAVAAILAVVIGIGFFGNWFNWRNTETSIPADEITEQKTPLTGKESSGVPVQDAKPAPSATSRIETAEGVVKDDLARKDIDAAPAHVGLEAGDRAPADLRQQYWATGTVTNELDEGAGAVRATEEADKLQLEKKGERSKGVRTYRPGASKPSPAVQAIVVDQRPPSTLPTAQQALHYQSGTRAIQSLIEERADTIRVILYPDSPIDRETLQNARAERIGEDSLVITLERQQIGIRLPPELRQTRKTR